MAFPRPDNAVEEFPTVDAGRGWFPAVDAGPDVFPPAPIPTIFAVAGLAMSPFALVGALPWRDAEVFLEMSPAAGIAVAVEVQAAALLEIVPDVTPVEELSAPVDIEMAPAAALATSVEVPAAAALELAAGIQGVPVAVVIAAAVTTLSATAAVAVEGIITAPTPLVMLPSGTPTAATSVAAAAALAMTPSTTQQVITFLPSGMIKSGSSGNITTTYTQVGGGWAADTANYPGSTVSGNDLVIQSNGSGITVAASVVWTGDYSFGTRTVTMRLRYGTAAQFTAGTAATLVTGTATAVPNNNGTATLTLTATGQTVQAGYLIRLEALASHSNTMSAQANPASYVRVFLP